MLLPKKTKYRKVQKGRNRGLANNGTEISFGTFALQAMTADRVTSRQIEAARRAMTRYVKRGGKIWIRIFPDIPVTNTPHDVGMGGGKGNPEYFAARVKPGMIIFEMDGISRQQAQEAMRLASHKLPVKTRFIERRVIGGES